MVDEEADSLAPVLWRFANAEFSDATHELCVGGQPVALERKPLEVLRCLLLAEGELVTKQELFDSVWAGRVVTDGVLSQAIFRIREVLGDADRSLLRTVHGYGFRLDAPIAVEGRADTGTRLEFEVGATVPGLDGWVLEERLSTRPHNELWRIQNPATTDRRVLKLALNERAERVLKREVTLNRVLLKELGDDAPLAPLERWQFETQPCWILMPWYPAGSLADWIDGAGGADALPLQRRVDIVAEAADMLAKAHALGVMHKDIKPGNLLVDESGDEPHLLMCDFGSGTVASRERLERAGVTVMGFTQTIRADVSTTGTPAYMAPEVLAGGVFSVRSDVYSLGVLLYQLIAGNLQQPLAPGWEEDIDDAGLREIIAAACAGKPERRVGSMAELARQLRDWRPGAAQSPAARSATDPTTAWPETSSRARKPRPALAFAIVAFALLIIAAGLWWAMGPRDQGPALSPQAGTPTDKGERRVALLPFELLGLDEQTLLIMSGLQDALASDLADATDWRLVMGRGIADMGLAGASPGVIGEALRTERLIRGSIQQLGQALRVNMQIIDATDGETRWGGSVQGTRADLFALQTRIGEALSAALGTALEMPTLAPASPAAYAQYLETLARFQANDDVAEVPLRLAELEQVLAEDPAFLQAHELAIAILIDGYHWAVLTRSEVESGARRHLAAIQRLSKDPLVRARNEALLARRLELDPQRALDLMTPHSLRLNASDRFVIANALARLGRVTEAIPEFQQVVEMQPGWLRPALSLAYYQQFVGDGAAAWATLRALVARIPDSRSIRHTPRWAAYASTGDRIWLERWLATGNAQPLQFIVPAVDLARLDGDRDTMLAAASALPEEGQSLASEHAFNPNALIKAVLLDAAGGPPDEVRDLARRAADESAAFRARSDSAASQVFHAQALALLGETEQALALYEAGRSAVATSKDMMHREFVTIYGVLVLAYAGETEHLVAVIDKLLAGPIPGMSCAVLGLSSLYEAVRRVPGAQAALESGCRPLWDRNRAALAAAGADPGP